MITISIVEDNADFRNVLAGYLRSQSGFLVKGVYEHAEAALKGLLSDRPDIAIVDIKMPGINGIELINRVKQSIPDTLYMICTAHNDNETVFKALQSGALGYLLKDADGDTIINSIYELYNGGAPMSPYIARKVISRMQTSISSKDEFDLTAREKDILQKLAQGLLYKEIADSTNISLLTVKSHVKNIYRKLQVQNKVEAINKYKAY